MKINKLFVVSRYVFTALNFLAILVITSLLTTSDFGVLSFFRLVMQYLMYSEFGFIQFVFRKRAADGAISDVDLSNILTYIAISIFSFLFVFALLDLSVGAFFSNPLYVVLASLSVLFGVSSKFVVDQLRISGQTNRLVALEFVTNSIIYITVLICWFTDYRNVDVFVAMYGLYMAPYFILIFCSSTIFNKIKRFSFNFVLNKKIIYSSSMLFAFGFLSLIFSSVDRLIIKYYLEFESLGLYAMAFTVSTGFYMVIQTITWVNMPSFIKTIKNDSISKSMAAFKKYMFKMQMIYLSVVTLGLPLYYFLVEYYNPRYKNTLWIFALLSIYNYINIFYIYHRTYLLTFEYYKLLNITLGVGIVINVILNLFLVKFNIIEVLVVGSILSHIFYMLIVRYIVIKKAKN